MKNFIAKAPLIKIFNPKISEGVFEVIFQCEIYANFSSNLSKLSWDESHVLSFVYNNRHFGLEFPLEKEIRYFTNKIKSIELREDDQKKYNALLDIQVKNMNKKGK